MLNTVKFLQTQMFLGKDEKPPKPLGLPRCVIDEWSGEAPRLKQFRLVNYYSLLYLESLPGWFLHVSLQLD